VISAFLRTLMAILSASSASWLGWTNHLALVRLYEDHVADAYLRLARLLFRYFLPSAAAPPASATRDEGGHKADQGDEDCHG
jgi:hypothetical protein